MRKTVVAIAIALTTVLSVNAQWSKHNFVDDFGDKTDSEYKAMMVEGTFSNSATQNSKLKCKFVDNFNSKGLTIYIYEYGRSLATGIENSFLTLKIKDSKSKIHTIKKVFYSKAGMLFLDGKQYEQIMEVISSPGDYTMIFNIGGSYSSSSYKLKFEIN